MYGNKIITKPNLCFFYSTILVVLLGTTHL